MFHRILVPVDGSARAARAIPIAARVARAVSGDLVLVRVLEPLTPYGPYFAGPSVSDEDRAEELCYLERLRASDVLRGITATPLIMSGPAAAEILKAATEQQADLIMLCSRGRTGVVRWALGSVAHRVARRAPMPVLVVRDADHERAALPLDDATRPVRMLVPLDGSPLAETAIRPALDLLTALAPSATNTASTLHLVVIVRPEDLDSSVTPPAALEDRAATYLVQLAANLQVRAPCAANVRVTWSVAHSRDVAGALIDLASGERRTVGPGRETPPRGFDVIAMSTHGYTGREYWALGSVTERVLEGARLPLLILRPAAADCDAPVAAQATAGEPTRADAR